MQNDELMHYGIKGMKWGVRRAREQAGSAGNYSNHQMRKEYKHDKKKAFEIGRDATVLGRSMKYGVKKNAKLEKKMNKAYEKDPNSFKSRTRKKAAKFEASKKALDQISSDYKKTCEKGKQHVEELIKKYGKENVKEMKFKEFSVGGEKTMLANERVSTGKEWISSFLVTAATAGLPIRVIMSPASKNYRGKSLYNNTYSFNRIQQKRRGTITTYEGHS